MPEDKRKLIPITGIPGTGKTCCGNFFAAHFGFTHHNLEDPPVWEDLLSNPSKFIEKVIGKGGNVVATWGFVPNEDQIGVVNQFRESGFKLIWFDGNRPAAFREYIKKKGLQEDFFISKCGE